MKKVIIIGILLISFASFVSANDFIDNSQLSISILADTTFYEHTKEIEPFFGVRYKYNLGDEGFRHGPLVGAYLNEYATSFIFNGHYFVGYNWDVTIPVLDQIYGSFMPYASVGADYVIRPSGGTGVVVCSTVGLVFTFGEMMSFLQYIPIDVVVSIRLF